MSTRELDGKAVEFGTAGYTMDHVFVLYDRGSNTVWYPGSETLEAVGGQRRGDSVPFIDEPAPVTLAAWLAEHPKSQVLLPSAEDVKALNRPYLGARLEDRDERVVVIEVFDETPAAEAGLKVDDILIRLGEHAIGDRRAIRGLMGEFSAGDRVDLLIERAGKQMTLPVTLAARGG